MKKKSQHCSLVRISGLDNSFLSNIKNYTNEAIFRHVRCCRCRRHCCRLHQNEIQYRIIYYPISFKKRNNKQKNQIKILTMQSFFKNMQNTAFDSFDPGVSYFDPTVMKAGANNATGDAGSSTVQATPGQKMQVNLTLTNAAAVLLTFEMFNYLNSYTRILNSTYVSGNYQYIPLLTLEGLAEFALTTKRVVGFAANGDLHINGSAAAADPTATIGCGEIGYSAFFEASNTTPFVVSFLRFTCETSGQIDQQITWFKKTFSGGEVTNKISPRAYFKPTQFQSFIIDITVNFSIGYDSGIRTKLIAGEVVTLSLFINMWTEQAF